MSINLTNTIILILISASISIGITEYGEQFYHFFLKPEIIQDEIELQAFFCQTEDCEKIFLTLIKNSVKINCAFYDLALESIINALVLKSNNVNLIIDSKYAHKIENTKLNYITDLSSKQMHNKFCIFNDNIILTGSTNPTLNGIKKNDNNVIIIRSEKLAENYLKEFDEMFEDKEFQNKESDQVIHDIIIDSENEISIQNYFCPEDNCENKVNTILQNAKESVYFMIFSFTSDALGNTLVEHNNISIKGVLESTQNKNSKYSEYETLTKKYGDNIRLDTNPNNMHHKVFIVDNRTIITGSYNPTRNGNEQNDENLLIINNKEIAQKYLVEFQRIWDAT